MGAVTGPQILDMTEWSEAADGMWSVADWTVADVDRATRSHKLAAVSAAIAAMADSTARRLLRHLNPKS